MSPFLVSQSEDGADEEHRYAHRTRKEGHTKIIEYGLVPKQRHYHKAAGIRRRNVLLLQALAARSQAEDAIMDGRDEDGASEEESESEEEDEVVEFTGNGKGKGKGRKRRGSSTSEESEDAEKQEMGMDVDEDADHSSDEELDEQGRKEKDVGGMRKKQTERIVPPDEVRAHLRLLFKHEAPIVALLYAPHGPLATTASPVASTSKASADIFFMDVVCVPPTRFRPAATMGDQVFENPQNSLLNGILRQTFTVRDLSVAFAQASMPVSEEVVELVGEKGRPKPDKARLYTQLLESLINLQIAVTSMMDSTKNPMIVRGGKLPPPGVKQLLEKKDGLFRKNMMVRPVFALSSCTADPARSRRESESTTPPGPSSPPTSTSRRTRLESLPSSLASSHFPNPSPPTTFSTSVASSSTAPTFTPERATSRWKTATSSP